MNGDTPNVTSMPSRTWYHRSLGWHAPELRRAVVVAGIGAIVALVLARFVAWELAVIGGWDAAALIYLGAAWPIIIRADSVRTEQLARVEDQTRGSATLLLLGASLASLLGVGFALNLAGRESGTREALLVAVAVLTVVLSWTVANTLFTLRYAHLYYASAGAGITFGDSAAEERPTFRDFAYVAFTVGMTYQVSDTTLRDPRIRRTVLRQAGLSYVFGVVIVAGAINLIAGLMG